MATERGETVATGRWKIKRDWHQGPGEPTGEAPLEVGERLAKVQAGDREMEWSVSQTGLEMWLCRGGGHGARGSLLSLLRKGNPCHLLHAPCASASSTPSTRHCAGPIAHAQ